MTPLTAFETEVIQELRAIRDRGWGTLKLTFKNGECVDWFEGRGKSPQKLKELEAQ